MNLAGSKVPLDDRASRLASWRSWRSRWPRQALRLPTTPASPETPVPPRPQGGAATPPPTLRSEILASKDQPEAEPARDRWDRQGHPEERAPRRRMRRRPSTSAAPTVITVTQGTIESGSVRHPRRKDRGRRQGIFRFPMEPWSSKRASAFWSRDLSMRSRAWGLDSVPDLRRRWPARRLPLRRGRSPAWPIRSGSTTRGCSAPWPAGATTIHVMSGAAGLVGELSAVLKLKVGTGAAGMLLRDAPPGLEMMCAAGKEAAAASAPVLRDSFTKAAGLWARVARLREAQGGRRQEGQGAGQEPASGDAGGRSGR